MSEFSHSIEPWIEFWAAGLWRASWQGGIVLGGVWAIARCCKSLSPWVMCWLWRLACLKLLFALVWAQPVQLAVLPAEPRALAAIESASLPATGATDAPPSSRAEDELLSAPRATVEQGGVDPRVWLFALWAAGVFYSMGGIARQWKSARRLLASATGEVSDSLREICRQEAARLRVRRPPQLRLSSRVDSPLLAGIWRPTIVLPAWGGQESRAAFDTGELRLIFAHELAHHRRRDLLWNWLPAVVRAVFFFHPLVWLMVRRWCEAQEAACDELLIQGRLAQPVEYGRLLLKVAAREALHSQPGLAAAGVLGAYRDLETRILTMTRVRPYSFRRLAMAAGVLSLIAASGLIPWRFAPRKAALAATAATAATADSDDKSEAAKQPERLPGKIYVWASLDLSSDADWPHNYRGVISIDANSGAWEKVGPLGQTMRLSADGHRVAYSEHKQHWTRDGVRGATSELFLADIPDPQPVKLMDGAAPRAWSPDGRRLLYHVVSGVEGWYGASWTLELGTNEKQKLAVPETDQVEDWSSQGNWLVTISGRDEAAGNGYQVYVMHPDGSGDRRITQGKGGNLYPRFSPDGKQIAYMHTTRVGNSLWVVDVDGASPRQILAEQRNIAILDALCWSPDGRWLAMKVVESTDEPGNRKARLEIVSVADGERRVLQLENVTLIHFLQTPEWR